VYAVGHSVPTQHSAWMAAVLAYGEAAVLSHRSAAHHWDLRRSAAGRVDVTVPGRSSRGQRGIALHQVRRLDPRDTTVKDGLPITTVARTLLDNAEVLRERQIERMIEEAERLRLFDLAAIRETCDRNRGRRGIRLLRAILGATYEVPPNTKSDLEHLLVYLCRHEKLPLPAMNAIVEGYEVDAHWPGTIVIVELDSWSFHRTRRAFERDHERDLYLKLADYEVLRLTWRQLTRERAEVTRTLRALLGSGRTPRAPGPGARARALP
jgi:very-short-patch-repair endonuclease